ncbi:MAG: hypothetical protein UE295_00495 [Acutalibacteraceae bacterium]|nr:hypothetical protein [Acutalibacteraceae bacterium]
MAIQGLVSSFLNLAQTSSKALVSFTGTTGIAGFVFDIKEDEEITLESDITDHFTESNNPVQDNIVNRPVRVTLRGVVGEHVYNPPKRESSWDKIIGKVRNTTEKLTIIGSYVPPLSDFSTQVFNELKSDKKGLQSVWNIGSAAFDLYHNINVPNDRQTSAFMFFEALWQSKQTFSIQTPYRYYPNMAIETIKTVQNGETTDNTSFEITFKQINLVYTNSLVNEKSLWGRLKQQASDFGNGILSLWEEAPVDLLAQVRG